MLRVASVLIFLLSVFQIRAEDYAVFEKDGFYGIKDQAGEVKVPAVYDRLGWSDQQLAIVDGVIGFKENGTWGLISIQNKIVAEAKYHSIVPFEGQLFKAALKGKFSNQLFYGLVDSSGKTQVNFNYFSIDLFDSFLLVSVYEQKPRFGLTTLDGGRVIPPEYQAVRSEGDFFCANRFNGELDLFTRSGSAVSMGLDSIRSTPSGVVVYKGGYAGLVDKNGKLSAELLYKDIQVVDDQVQPVHFPTWEIFRGKDSVLRLQADSLQYGGGGFWKTFVNGNQHFRSTDSTYQFDGAFLRGVSENHYLLQSSRTGKWSAYTKQHENVLSAYDSIIITQYALWGQKNGSWELHNRFGKKRNRFAYQAVHAGIESQFIVRLNDHWGIMDPLGNLVTPIKYDAIEKDQGYYKVGYLGRFGIMDSSGSWKLRAEYAEVFVFDPLLVGRKGYSYSYFSPEGFLKRSTFVPSAEVGQAVLVRQEGLLGLMDREANVLVEPLFQEIRLEDGFYVVSSDSTLMLVDEAGKEIFGASLELQDFGGYSEGLFLVKKNGRWGFFDKEARLRIGNSYEAAGVFSQGLAPVRVRDRWGFIDTDEMLVIQPYYDEVSPFQNGLSIVRIKNRFGLIDELGKEVVKISWNEISRLPTGNYLLKDEYGASGLIDPSGRILLRPAFDHLVDFGNRVLVTKNGMSGLLDYQGNQIFRIAYKEIKIIGDHTTLKY